jgi:hypothetical protein
MARHRRRSSTLGMSPVFQVLGKPREGICNCGCSCNNQAEGEVFANLSLLDCVQNDLAAGRENARMSISLAEKSGDRLN